MDNIDASAAALLRSGGRDFGPLATIYAAAGLELPTVWLAPDADDICFPEQRDLLAWWLALAGPRLPAVAHIDPLSLRPYLGNLTLVEPTGDGDFLYRLHGSRISDAAGYELTGRRVSQGPRNGRLPVPIRTYFSVIYRVAMARAHPLYARHPARSGLGQPFRWHRLVLPFADGDTPERLLVSNIPGSLEDEALPPAAVRRAEG